MVEIRELKQDREVTGDMQGTCRPIPGQFFGAAMRRKVITGPGGGRNTVRITSHTWAYPHDGQPATWSRTC